GWVGKVYLFDAGEVLQEPLAQQRLRRVPALELEQYDHGTAGVSVAALAALRGLTGLRELSLGRNWNRSGDLSDGRLAALAELPHLGRLRLRLINLAGTALGRLTRLRELDIQASISRESEGTNWPDLEEAASLPHLERLRVQCSPHLSRHL